MQILHTSHCKMIVSLILDSNVRLIAQNGGIKQDAPFAIGSNRNGRGTITAGCLFDLMTIVLNVHAFDVILSERMVLGTGAVS